MEETNTKLEELNELSHGNFTTTKNEVYIFYNSDKINSLIK